MGCYPRLSVKVQATLSVPPDAGPTATRPRLAAWTWAAGHGDWHARALRRPRTPIEGQAARG